MTKELEGIEAYEAVEDHPEAATSTGDFISAKERKELRETGKIEGRTDGKKATGSKPAIANKAPNKA